jgi:hypothetical protein
MPVYEAAITAVDAAYLAVTRGEGDPLDGHLLLCREKVAASLALLCGEITVSDEFWALAKVVMDVSARTRGEVVGTMQRRAKEEQERKTAGAVLRQQRLEGDAEERAKGATLRQIAAHVTKAACEGGCRRRCVTNAIAWKYRQNVSIDEISATAIGQGLLAWDGDILRPRDVS